VNVKVKMTLCTSLRCVAEERNTPVIPKVTADLPPEKRWPVTFQQDAGQALELV